MATGFENFDGLAAVLSLDRGASDVVSSETSLICGARWLNRRLFLDIPTGLLVPAELARFTVCLLVSVVSLENAGSSIARLFAILRFNAGIRFVRSVLPLNSF